MQKHEADFLNVYKGHMYNIQKEMRMLREKVSEDELKRKRDEELKILESERDWFRNEALRLDKICKEYKRNLEIWKNKAQILEEDRKFMENQILVTKKQNLKLKEGMESQRELNLSAEKSWLRSEVVSRENVSRQAIEDNLSQSYFNTIKHLKSQIDIQKKSMKMQRSVQASYFLEKGLLEDFFIDCIEEVKKDISKRKSQNLPYSKLTPSSSVKNMQKPDNVGLNEFTIKDKKKVVELVVCREEVIKMLQELIFPKNTEKKIRPSTGVNHGLSHVFSTPSLRENKSLIRPSTAPKGWKK